MTLLIFDCDGVLVDSEPLASAAMAELMTALGHPMTAQQALEAFSGRRLRDVVAAAEALLSFPIPADVGKEAGRRLLERIRRELKPVPGVRETISRLPYPRCVASSSTLERIKVSLEATGLEHLFADSIFSADRVEHGKPAPDLYLLAARSLGATPADCIVIEDSPLGIQGAAAAGMQSIGFTGASHATGRLVRRLEAARANIVIGAMSDLPAAVDRLVPARA